MSPTAPRGKVFGDEHLHPQPEEWMPHYPWRTIGHLEAMRYPISSDSTGFLVGPRHILTAGHNLWDPASGLRLGNGWTTEFVPGKVGNAQPSGGPVRVVAAYFPTQYLEQRDDRYDLAIAVLEDLPRIPRLGWFGMCWAEDSWLENMTMVLDGYPAFLQKCRWSPLGSFKSCGGYQYRDWDSCKIDDARTARLLYRCDTKTGMSGSPLWAFSQKGTACAFGVHHGFLAGWHEAFRLTRGWIKIIQKEVICGQPSQFAEHGACNP